MALPFMEKLSTRRATPSDDDLRRVWDSVSPDGELATTNVAPAPIYRHMPEAYAERPLDTAMETALAEEAAHMRRAIDFYSWTGIPFAGGWWGEA